MLKAWNLPTVLVGYRNFDFFSMITFILISIFRNMVIIYLRNRPNFPKNIKFDMKSILHKLETAHENCHRDHKTLRHIINGFLTFVITCRPEWVIFRPYAYSWATRTIAFKFHLVMHFVNGIFLRVNEFNTRHH